MSSPPDYWPACVARWMLGGWNASCALGSILAQVPLSLLCGWSQFPTGTTCLVNSPDELFGAAPSVLSDGLGVQVQREALGATAGR